MNSSDTLMSIQLDTFGASTHDAQRRADEEIIDEMIKLTKKRKQDVFLDPRNQKLKG